MPTTKRPLWILIGTLVLTAGVWVGSESILPTRPRPQLTNRPVATPPLPGVDLPQRHGYVISMPELLPVADFKLIAHTGLPLTREDLKGRWNFLYFGYTFCPDACPLTLMQLKRLQQLSAQRGLDEDAAYWFISVDPERDTPQHLGDYVKYFHNKFQAATGDPRELAHLTNQLNVTYRVPAHHPGDILYSVDHPSTILLIDPDVRFHAMFMPPHDPETMVEDFAKLRAQYQVVQSESH